MTRGPTVGAWVTLNAFEQKIANYLARERTAEARAAGAATKFEIAGRDTFDTDREGFAGELVFCRLFNLYPDFTTHSRAGGSDAVWGGHTVDIKTRGYQGTEPVYLLCLTSRALASDVYALVLGRFPRYQFVGVASRAQVQHAERVIDFGHGACYAVAPDELFPVSPAREREPGEDDDECP